MIDIYAKCSRCGGLVDPDSYKDSLCFESVLFRRTTLRGTEVTFIDRSDKADRRAFAEGYSLCPECLADTLDFVRGKA